jgi:hypothetical protein
VELKDGEQCTAKYRWCHGRKSPWRIRRVRRHSTDLILTQIRETQAASQFPAEVNNFSAKTLIAPLMLISLYSPSGVYDSKFLVPW